MWLATWIWISRSFSKVIWHLMHWYVFFCSETEKIYILDSQEGGTGRKQSFPEVAAPDYPEGLWSPPRSPQDILSLPAFEPSSPAWGKTGGGAGVVRLHSKGAFPARPGDHALPEVRAHSGTAERKPREAALLKCAHPVHPSIYTRTRTHTPLYSSLRPSTHPPVPPTRPPIYTGMYTHADARACKHVHVSLTLSPPTRQAHVSPSQTERQAPHDSQLPATQVHRCDPRRSGDDLRATRSRGPTRPASSPEVHAHFQLPQGSPRATPITPNAPSDAQAASDTRVCTARRSPRHLLSVCLSTCIP